MLPATEVGAGARRARGADASTRVRRDVDRDAIRGRRLDVSQKFLPDGLSLAPRLRLPQEGEARLMSQIQGRTYVSLLGFVERLAGAGGTEAGRDPWHGDAAALVQFTGCELDRPALLRRLESMMEAAMPEGYAFLPRPEDVASAVPGTSTWAERGRRFCLANVAYAHSRLGNEVDAAMSPVVRDILAYHWLAASRHAIVDELEWRREHARLAPARRDAAVDDLIELVASMDRLLQVQAKADVSYFAAACGRRLPEGERAGLAAHVLAAYRWQHIVSGVQERRFTDVLQDLLTPPQMRRIGGALAPLVEATRWAS